MCPTSPTIHEARCICSDPKRLKPCDLHPHRVGPYAIGWGTDNDTLDAFMTTRHTCSWGITGVGKTTFIDEITHRLQTVCIVIWNPEELPFQGSTRVRSRRELEEAIKAGRWIIDYVPDGVPRDQLAAHFDTVMRPVWDLGTALKGSKEKIPPAFLVLVDEVDQVMPQNGNKSVLLDDMMRRGRKRGIFVHSTGQRPADVDKIVPTQAAAHIVFALQGRDLAYLEAQRLPIREFHGFLLKQYSFVVTEMDRWCDFPPLPRK